MRLALEQQGVLFFFSFKDFCLLVLSHEDVTTQTTEVVEIRGHVVLITFNVSLKAVCRHSQIVISNLPVRHLAEKCCLTHLSTHSITNLLSSSLDNAKILFFCALASFVVVVHMFCFLGHLGYFGCTFHLYIFQFSSFVNTNHINTSIQYIAICLAKSSCCLVVDSLSSLALFIAYAALIFIVVIFSQTHLTYFAI